MCVNDYSISHVLGRHAFVGMGFEDRGDAFDFNVTLQDHFKYVGPLQPTHALT